MLKAGDIIQNVDYPTVFGVITNVANGWIYILCGDGSVWNYGEEEICLVKVFRLVS